MTGNSSIYSIRNKYVLIENVIKAFYIFLVSESKLASTFPFNQFHAAGFSQYRRDRNQFGGGLLLHINEHIPCNPLNDNPKCQDEGLIIFGLRQKVSKNDSF